MYRLIYHRESAAFPTRFPRPVLSWLVYGPIQLELHVRWPAHTTRQSSYNIWIQPICRHFSHFLIFLRLYTSTLVIPKCPVRNITIDRSSRAKDSAVERRKSWEPNRKKKLLLWWALQVVVVVVLSVKKKKKKNGLFKKKRKIWWLFSRVHNCRRVWRSEVEGKRCSCRRVLFD